MSAPRAAASVLGISVSVTTDQGRPASPLLMVNRAGSTVG